MLGSIYIHDSWRPLLHYTTAQRVRIFPHILTHSNIEYTTGHFYNQFNTTDKWPSGTKITLFCQVVESEYVLGLNPTTYFDLYKKKDYHVCHKKFNVGFKAQAIW